MRDDDSGDLALVLSELARTLQGEGGVEETLHAIVRGAVDTVPGAQRCGVSLVVRPRSVTSRAPSDEVVRQLDELQSELGEGPCLDSAWEERTVSVPDMAAEGRWPRFSRRAAELGVGSMLSFQLFVREDTLGALNLFAGRPGAFSDESESVGGLFATHAAVALIGAQHEDQLRGAMDSRGLIGQAQGIVMVQRQMTSEQAFALLVAASQRTNSKLRDLAGRIVRDVELHVGARANKPGLDGR